MFLETFSKCEFCQGLLVRFRQRWDIGRRWFRGIVENHGVDPGTSRDRRGPQRRGGHGQHGSVGNHTTPAGIRDGDSLESKDLDIPPVDLAQVGISQDITLPAEVGGQQVDHRAIFQVDRFENQQGFKHHVHAGSIGTLEIEVGELLLVGNRRDQAIQLKPLAWKAVAKTDHLAVIEHAVDLFTEHRRITKPACFCQVQQRIVRNAAPEEKGKSRGKVEVVAVARFFRTRFPGSGRAVQVKKIGGCNRRANKGFHGVRKTGTSL